MIFKYVTMVKPSGEILVLIFSDACNHIDMAEAAMRSTRCEIRSAGFMLCEGGKITCSGSSESINHAGYGKVCRSMAGDDELILKSGFSLEAAPDGSPELQAVVALSPLIEKFGRGTMSEVLGRIARNLGR